MDSQINIPYYFIGKYSSLYFSQVFLNAFIYGSSQSMSKMSGHNDQDISFPTGIEQLHVFVLQLLVQKICF